MCIRDRKSVAGTLRLDLAAYRELQAFTQFGSDLDKATQDQLNRGAHMTELLKQGRYVPLSFMDQSIAIYAGAQGYLDDIPVSDTVRFRTELLEYLHANAQNLIDTVQQEKKFSDETKTALDAAIGSFKTQFAPSE